MDFSFWAYFWPEGCSHKAEDQSLILYLTISCSFFTASHRKSWIHDSESRSSLLKSQGVQYGWKEFGCYMCCESAENIKSVKLNWQNIGRKRSNSHPCHTALLQFLSLLHILNWSSLSEICLWNHWLQIRDGIITVGVWQSLTCVYFAVAEEQIISSTPDGERKFNNVLQGHRKCHNTLQSHRLFLFPHYKTSFTM